MRNCQLCKSIDANDKRNENALEIVLTVGVALELQCTAVVRADGRGYLRPKKNRRSYGHKADKVLHLLLFQNRSKASYL